MKEAPERQAREPEGSGEGKGTGGESSQAVAPSVCGGVQVVHRASVCTGWDPNPNRESEAKPQADEVCLYLFWLLFFGGI